MPELSIPQILILTKIYNSRSNVAIHILLSTIALLSSLLRRPLTTILQLLCPTEPTLAICLACGICPTSTTAALLDRLAIAEFLGRRDAL